MRYLFYHILLIQNIILFLKPILNDLLSNKFVIFTNKQRCSWRFC